MTDTHAGHTSVAVELRGVRKSFGVSKDVLVCAADDVSLRFPAGEFVALTGASGSGKSTLLHMIGAMERPDSGAIFAGQTEITALRRSALASYRRSVGFVFQRYHLLPALTALDNVIAPVLPYRTAFNKRERGRELLAAVAVYAVGGTDLLEQKRADLPGAALLLSHLRPDD